MTKSNHTPGPWALDDKTGSITHGDVSFGAPIGAGGFIVASHSVPCIPKHQSERLTNEHRANARLIAAAPNLLAALTSIMHLYDASVFLDAGRLPSSLLYFRDARAAIAKATGEA